MQGHGSVLIYGKGDGRCRRRVLFKGRLEVRELVHCHLPVQPGTGVKGVSPVRSILREGFEVLPPGGLQYVLARSVGTHCFFCNFWYNGCRWVLIRQGELKDSRLPVVMVCPANYLGRWFRWLALFQSPARYPCSFGMLMRRRWTWSCIKVSLLNGCSIWGMKRP